ncbi:7584_t:CDS:2, partial [Racocetra fulgida]
ETVLELLEITQEGDLIPIIEQPMFGTIKDLAVLHCNFSGPLLCDPVNGTAQMYLGDNISELQHLRMIPGQDVLVCLSDSGVLSFIAYTECVNVHFNEGQQNVHKGKGRVDSSIPLSQPTQPGFDYQELGRLASSSQQYVYAGTENGDLYRIDIISDVQIEYTLLQNGLNSIGTAMTMLCFDPNFGDFVILSGEMSDGTVVLAEIACSIPNWAPILDFQMLDFHQERHDVIFTCSGRDKHGSIRELRKAVCVNIITRTADSFLALSYANSTRLMKVSQGELHDISEYSGLDLEVSSLCVASFSSAPGFVIQIHRLKIVVSEPKVGMGAIVENNCITSSRWTWTPPENTVIEVAAVHDSTIVIGLSTINGNVIALLRLDFDDT